MDGLLIFGKTGQVATELARRMPGAVFAGRDSADLSRPAECGALIDRLRPRAVINAAAYTAVDKAESDAATAHRVNGDAPAQMALACARLHIPFVHLSTDYVFDGSGSTPRDEIAQAAPLSVYGATKLAGEDGIHAAGGQAAILRTSWVFSAHGANFVKTIRRLGTERSHLRIVADQIGGPTPAHAIAAAVIEMTRQMCDDPAKGGIYHFAGAPDTSWAGFARAILSQSGLDVSVEEIPTDAYPTPARRPANSRLDCRAITRDFGIPRPGWHDGLSAVIRELSA